MTAICRTTIEHPSAWTAAQLGSVDAIARLLRSDELAAFDDLLVQTRHLLPQEVVANDVTQPELLQLIAELSEIVMHGRGAVLLRGLQTDRYTPQDLERIYWALGTHLGIPAVQSRTGDRLGRVERDDQDPVARGYRSASELTMHTDSYEVVGLLSIRRALRGGESALVSSLAIHNEILRTRPHLLPALYEGFYMAIPEAQLGSEPVTPTKIPVFCYRDGKVSCMFAASFMREAARKMGTSLPADLAEGLAYLSELAKRDDLALRFMLQPGELLLWHNFTNLHSRTEFEDAPDHKRLLLRLWLTVPDGRPVDPAFYVRGAAYERVYREYHTGDL